MYRYLQSGAVIESSRSRIASQNIQREPPRVPTFYVEEKRKRVIIRVMNEKPYEKPQDLPSYETPEYKETRPLRDIVHDVSDGETALKAKGATYLPKFPRERESSYKNRLAIATTFPALSKTIGGMVGLVFRKDPKLGTEDTSPSVAEDWENIDNAGTHGDVFIRDVFEDFITDGYSFIVVDFPQPDPNVTSASAERASGRRPYWIHYEADQALNWRYATINNEKKLQQITFREVTCEPDGEFVDKEVTRYRVWTLAPNINEAGVISTVAMWALYEIVDDEKGGKVKVEVGRGTTSLSELPVAVIGEIGSEPPLLDLARLNIRYRQQDSDYQKAIQFAGLVVAWAKELKVEGSADLAWGFDTMLLLEEKGEAGLIETTGEALNGHKTALEDLKMDMAKIGLSILVDPVSQPKTATESNIDNTQENSQLGAWARTLIDAVEWALYFHALYIGDEKSGSIDIGASLRQFTMDAQEMTALAMLQDKGQISLETLWQLMARADKLPSDFDGEAERKRISAVDVVPLQTQ